MLTKKKISIVVPVYRSQENIETLAIRVEDSLKATNYELIMINDCSPDKSWEEIKKVTLTNKKIIAINLRKNSGQDNAIMAGFSKASGDYVVVMDDDLQHDPRDIRKLVRGLEKGDYDVCFARFPKKKHKFWKNIGSWINGKMAELTISKPRHIYLSPFKILQKEIVDEIIKYEGPYPYVDGIIFSITQNVMQIDIDHHERYRGESNYTLIKSFAVWLKLMTSFSVFPLRIATLIGIFASIFGFLLAMYYLTRYLFIGSTVEGWTSLMIMLLLLCGTILLALGAIGEYVGRSYIQLYKKPQYSIKDVLSS